MRVWRVQTEDGRGPYQSSVYGKWRTPPSHHGCPMPQMDGMDGCTREHIFGFVSRQQLLDWFPADGHASMGEVGLHEAIYEVPEEHIVLGGTQLCFVRDRARLVRQERMRSTVPEHRTVLPGPRQEWFDSYMRELTSDIEAVVSMDRAAYDSLRKRSDNRCRNSTTSSVSGTEQRCSRAADSITMEVGTPLRDLSSSRERIWQYSSYSPTGSLSRTMSEAARRPLRDCWSDMVALSPPPAPTVPESRSSGTAFSVSAQPSLAGTSPDSAGE